MSKLCTFLTEGARVKLTITQYRKYRMYIVARGVLRNQNSRSLAPRLQKEINLVKGIQAHKLPKIDLFVCVLRPFNREVI